MIHRCEAAHADAVKHAEQHDDERQAGSLHVDGALTQQRQPSCFPAEDAIELLQIGEHACPSVTCSPEVRQSHIAAWSPLVTTEEFMPVKARGPHSHSPAF